MTDDAAREASRVTDRGSPTRSVEAIEADVEHSQNRQHEHRNCRADERVWLERLPDEAATMDLHSFCVECGGVRSTQPIRGRPMGFFERAIANLKGDLVDNPRYPKLAQVHSHLISKALASIPDFDDPYTMPYETQWTIFVSTVQRFRPDLDVEFIERALPREPRRRRPAVIDLIASAGGMTQGSP